MVGLELEAGGALLLRPDAIVAWHSASAVDLADAYAQVLGQPAVGA
ncbi:hypothetical protein [Amycolatopsis sp. FDAARGOS 1241]|nr:hypothetical protein [Amycolatopsis sp. FDAARGOS 1241]